MKATTFVARGNGLDGMMPVNELYQGKDKKYVLLKDFLILEEENEKLNEELQKMKHLLKEKQLSHSDGINVNPPAPENIRPTIPPKAHPKALK